MKIHVFDYPTVVWRPLSSEPPRISALTLYWQKLESLGYIFVADSIDLSSFKFFTVSSERRTCFETECIMTLQSHPRSLILAPIESAYMTSYSTSIVTLVLSFRVSEILELLYAESLFSAPHPYSGENFVVFPLDETRDVCVAKSEHTRLTDGEIISEEFQPMWSQFTNVTDRRTDRQTTCDGNTALCTKVHRAVKTIFRTLVLIRTVSSQSRGSFQSAIIKVC